MDNDAAKRNKFHVLSRFNKQSLNLMKGNLVRTEQDEPSERHLLHDSVHIEDLDQPHVDEPVKLYLSEKSSVVKDADLFNTVIL